MKNFGKLFLAVVATGLPPNLHFWNLIGSVYFAARMAAAKGLV